MGGRVSFSITETSRLKAVIKSKTPEPAIEIQYASIIPALWRLGQDHEFKANLVYIVRSYLWKQNKISESERRDRSPLSPPATPTDTHTETYTWEGAKSIKKRYCQ